MGVRFSECMQGSLEKESEGTWGHVDGATTAKMRNTGKHLNMDDCACASGSSVFHLDTRQRGQDVIILTSRFLGDIWK